MHVFMDLTLCTSAQSCWKRNGPSPNCSHKVRSMELSKIMWYADTFNVLFTGTKGPCPAPEKHSHSIIPLHKTLRKAQYNQTSTVLLATTKTRLVHYIARWRSVIRHLRKRTFTAVESSGSMLYMIACYGLRCTYNVWLG
ncbi:hypothetical protein ATANTOWER_004537 [Ataeniobius toweri]|uniref:Uncharacterized protein n=1 Tax=Ataeniobius toweri TaxID=208326 RepID=A0ABU7C7I9_9TELE|nr:hypothetical protein [Ataeniobius toweri]